jgi:hypothetical protein
MYGLVELSSKCEIPWDSREGSSPTAFAALILF